MITYRMPPGIAATKPLLSVLRRPMSDILETPASTLAKQGAPVLGGMIGTAIPGEGGRSGASEPDRHPEPRGADSRRCPADPQNLRLPARVSD